MDDTPPYLYVYVVIRPPKHPELNSMVSIDVRFDISNDEVPANAPSPSLTDRS